MSFLKQLRVPEGPPPKRIADHQFYMQHPDFKQKVLEEYATNYAETPRNQRLAVKCKIAHTLLENESEEVKCRIKQEAAEEHEALAEAYTNRTEALPSADEEERQMYVRSFLISQALMS
jgi:hypothetical protein